MQQNPIMCKHYRLRHFTTSSNRARVRARVRARTALISLIRARTRAREKA